LIRFSCGLGLDKWNQFWTGINERVIRAIFSPKPHELSKKKNTQQNTHRTCRVWTPKKAYT